MDEKLAYLDGKLDAVSYMCAVLLGTSVISEDLIRLVENQVRKLSGQSGAPAISQAYVKGYSTVAPLLDTARKISDLIRRIPDADPGAKTH
jgi:hypothetical protein